MTDELFSLRVTMVSPAGEDQDVFAQAMASASVPIEPCCVGDAASATSFLSHGTDVLYLDSAVPYSEIGKILAAARGAGNKPFTISLTDTENGVLLFDTDALARKPEGLEETKRFVERSIRTRLASRVLVVDDSATMRSIVRKLLAGTRFPLDVTEADEGFTALKMARESSADLVFLDYNMPGFSGLETLAEFKREKLRVNVVLMTSVTDETLGDRAREQGAAFLKKPFYQADIEAVLCRYYGLRALNPKRA